MLIFLFALFLTLTFSNPALFLNDEWITVNQLHQLGEGHQVTVNEGKYGTFLNGTPGPYFQARHNLLGYTMMLPVLSLPALWFFGLFGDQFRLAIVLLWSFLPVAMAVLVDAYRPQYARWHGVRWTWLVIGAAFAGLLANLALYYPWPFTAPDAPIETAAVIFTNHLLFAALAVMIYLICKIVFEDTWFSIFGTIACIACSSYVFWAANAKDHMLLIAMTAAVVLFLVRYIRYGSLRDAALGFAFIGLLAWARPEVGFTVFVFAALYYVALQVSRGLLQKPPVEAVRALCIPLATVIGAIPLLINNALVTGNPLVPAFYVYEKKLLAGASGEEIIGAGEAVNGVVQSVPAPPGGISGFLSVLANHFSPSWSTLPGDIFGILFAPASGNMSLVAVSPLIVLAIILLPVIYLDWRRGERPQNLAVVAFLVVIACAVWVAYTRSLPGLNASHGIVPDIRYLAPFYLPAGLLGIYAISRFNGGVEPKRRTFWQIAAIGVVAPVLLVAMMLIQPYGGQYPGYTMFFTQITFALLAAALVLIAVKKRFGIPDAWIAAVLLLLVAVPFTWQLMMVFLYSVAKFNGYPLWIPLVEAFFQHNIGVSGLENL
ncbi:glycosyltransferase family 39 protein [Methanoculleus chikugoensis]|uniref:glycosyltransferase family 39 protein n=1 Tax=Methanoculleus chikugoensis TaxID=118126 RepID=UPI0009429E93|nr:glycosyltransferase family 39 protein [Methanoculleus chikugoensis]